MSFSWHSHFSMCSPLTSSEFLADGTTSSSTTAIGSGKVGCPMLKHLPHSGMDHHKFNLSWSLHFFLPPGSLHLIFPSIRWENLSIHLLPFSPFFFTSCVSKLFERIILCLLLFFLESNSILSPTLGGFRPSRSTLDQILYLFYRFQIGFTNPSLALR